MRIDGLGYPRRYLLLFLYRTTHMTATPIRGRDRVAGHRRLQILPPLPRPLCLSMARRLSVIIYPSMPGQRRSRIRRRHLSTTLPMLNSSQC